ncbi:MAG: recombinase family protein, partial [Acidimicrobiia bacterium]
MVGYVRASSDRQETSCADQEAELRRWCEARGGTLERVFADDGVSGSDLERPGLLALLAFLERERGGTLLMWRPNRLARALDPRDALELERRIDRAGWKRTYVHGGATTGDVLADTLLSVVEAHKAGSYLRDLSVDTLRGAARAYSQGKACASGIPYGFAKAITGPDGSERVVHRGQRHRLASGETARLVPGHPAEVAVVERMFKAYAAGRTSLLELAKALNADRVPGPKGGLWAASSVRWLLQRDEYVGTVCWGKRATGKVAQHTAQGPVLRPEADRERSLRQRDEDVVRVEDAHEPLVAREVWDAVQALLARRGKGKGPKEREARTLYPLGGLIACGHCGSSMAANGDRRPCYVCMGGSRKGVCEPYRLRCEVLHRALLAKIGQAYAPLKASARMRRRVEAHVRRELEAEGYTGTDVRVLERERDKLVAQITTAIANMGEVPATVARRVGEQIEVWEGRLRELEAEIVRAMTKPTPNPALVLEDALGLLGDLEQASADAERSELRALFTRTVERVELTFARERVRRGRGRPGFPCLGGRVALAPVLAAMLMAMGPAVAQGAPVQRDGVSHECSCSCS